MNKYRLSASGIKTFLKCSSSALHEPEQVRPNVYKEQSAHGIMVHKFVECIYGGMAREEALDAMSPHERGFCSIIDVDALPDTLSARAEVAFSYDTNTGIASEIRVNGPRDYPWNDGVIYGTADVVSATFDVYDIKTGNSPVDDPLMNAQLYFFALCLMRVYKPKPSYLIGIVFIHDDGSVETVARRVSAEKLAAFETRIVSAYSTQTLSRQEIVNSGCSFCNRRIYCDTMLATRAMHTAGVDISDADKLAISRVYSDHAKTLRDNVRDGTSLVRKYEVADWCDILRVASEFGQLESLIGLVPGVTPTKALPPELVQSLRSSGLVKSRSSIKTMRQGNK